MQHPSLILTRPTGRRGRWGVSGGSGGPAAATALAVAATTALAADHSQSTSPAGTKPRSAVTVAGGFRQQVTC